MFSTLSPAQLLSRTNTISSAVRRLSAIASTMSGPASVKLYTAQTPNGFQAAILLEELKAAYPGKIDYSFQSLSFAKNEQKEPWFLKINPNGRIPAIVDQSRGDFAVFETAAILLYLTQHYDPEFKFSFDPANDPNNYSEALQWIFFSHGGIGPMQGQANHFFRYAPEKIPYGINRYIEETKRLYSVLDTRLSGGREYLAGSGAGRFSIADIKAFPWVRGHGWAGVDNLAEHFPNVQAWLDRIEARPGVYAGLGVPARGKKMTKEEEEQSAKEAAAWILKGNQK